MKKSFYFICIAIIVAISACKKDQIGTGDLRVTKIKFICPGYTPINADYIFDYSSNGKINKITKNGRSAGDTFVFQYYYTTHLDSVQKIRNSDHVVTQLYPVHWGSDKIFTFLSFPYTLYYYAYDDQDRVLKRMYSNADTVLFDYSLDSIRAFVSSPGSIISPASVYETASFTVDNSVYNPFLIVNNKLESGVTSYIINSNFIDADYFVQSPYMLNFGQYYLSDGTKDLSVHYTFEGSTGGFPDRINYIEHDSTRFVFEFEYEPL